MSRLNVATIDCHALSHNLARVRQCAPRSKILAMIKANGYGHGLVTTAKALMNADAFGVASLEEALTLREAGVQKTIVMMAGFFEENELEVIARERLSFVLQNEWQLQMLESARLAKPIDVWLKVNTGMNRLGFDLRSVHEKMMRLRATGMVREVGLMSHMSDADAPGSEKTQRQINLFQRLCLEFKGPKSLANSAGILGWPESHMDWVRPGAMLYGISMFKDKVGTDFQLKPAMTLTSRIIAIQPVKPGDTIGYGSTYRVEREMKIAIVCMGYGDGYPRHAASGTPVLINGVRCPTVGRVSMDMLAVELKTDARLQDEVTLWGKDLPVEVIAEHSGTIPLELVSKLTARVQHKIIQSSEVSDVSLA